MGNQDHHGSPGDGIADHWRQLPRSMVWDKILGVGGSGGGIFCGHVAPAANDAGQEQQEWRRDNE